MLSLLRTPCLHTTLRFEEGITPRGLLSPKLYVDVPAGPRKSDFFFTNFLPNFPPITIPFLKEKHLILTQLGVFYNNLPKIHPIYAIWAPSSWMKTPRSLPNFAKKRPTRQTHVRIPCQCENPPALLQRCQNHNCDQNIY